METTEYDLIEHIDPDWKDHFLTVDLALAFYSELDPALVAQAFKELQA